MSTPYFLNLLDTLGTLNTEEKIRFHSYFIKPNFGDIAAEYSTSGQE